MLQLSFLLPASCCLIGQGGLGRPTESLDQLTALMKYWSGGTSVAGQQLGYGFDTIGAMSTVVKFLASHPIQ